MTCEECRRFANETDPLEVTRAELSAICRHFENCAECSNWIHSQIDEDTRDPLEKLTFDIQAILRIQELAADPEATI